MYIFINENPGYSVLVLVIICVFILELLDRFGSAIAWSNRECDSDSECDEDDEIPTAEMIKTDT